MNGSLATGWVEKKLGDVARPVGGGTPTRTQPKYWKGNIPWASVKDFSDDAITLHDTEEHISLEGLESCASNLIPENTPVVCTRMAVGRCALTTQPTAINQDLKALVIDGVLDPRYFVRLIQLSRSKLERLSIGSTVRGISTSDLLGLALTYPTKDVQFQIAAILDTIDDAIAHTEAVLAKLRQIRAGLLHDLLTRGLDENGQLRDPVAHPEQFKDSPLGRIPREWTVGNVSDLAINCDANRIPLRQADRDLRHGKYPYYGASGVIDYIDSYIFDGIFVLVGEDGENLRSRQLPLAFVVTGKFWVNNHAHILEPRPNADARFLATILELQDYIPWLIGSAQPKLTQRNLGFIKLRIPPPNEQKKISDFLDIAGKYTNTVEDEVDKLKHIKCGLMTNLLSGCFSTPEG